jgi:hypothetical protein
MWNARIGKQRQPSSRIAATMLSVFQLTSLSAEELTKVETYVFPHGLIAMMGLGFKEAPLCQINFDVNPFAVSGVNPRHDQHNMTRRHLISDRLAQLGIIIRTMDGIILWNRVISEREVRAVPKQAYQKIIRVGVPPRVADE